MANRVKITVIKKTLQSELIEKFHHGGPINYCTQFEVGDEFYCTTTKLPENFCAWAFGDISREIALVAYDPAGKTNKVTCCTSGYHNVYFYIESAGKE